MRAAVLLVLVGCYSPTPAVGLPCAPNGACPSGQTCDEPTGRCVLPGGPPAIDARAIDAPPAVTDARGDAPPDAGNLSGCADGQREAFASIQSFPDIAGCAATWSGAPSMRDPAAGNACGDDLGACAVPAAACAPGWHVCGASGDITELTAISVEDCHGAAQTGRFIAGMSHCADNASLCTYAANLPCYGSGWCSEPVCCGPGCFVGAGCPSGIWPDGTWITGDNADGCAAQPAAQDLGVLCCRN